MAFLAREKVWDIEVVFGWWVVFFVCLAFCLYGVIWSLKDQVCNDVDVLESIGGKLGIISSVVGSLVELGGWLCCCHGGEEKPPLWIADFQHLSLTFSVVNIRRCTICSSKFFCCSKEERYLGGFCNGLTPALCFCCSKDERYLGGFCNGLTPTLWLALEVADQWKELIFLFFQFVNGVWIISYIQ